ncbi:Na+/H+ antiporter NhaC family protein [Lysobacter yananisis]|uniref:Na+/H+ antiporter family n=2 Tax=Lysobacter TaxID=68 RepID=A0A0S2DEL8_LYSEN|nr:MULTISPECIES: Na+/H+ antiporter NhaC family protein [Lysobacter]ALN57013.1 Na+/H+ antiporter family [Lysobacter enzymogenes]QCW25716.1 Na+/H+ antiporter NhaC family protein [Lysobacter enzymogenes]WMT02979.1 Na+/H+ antiporter NhaC family protein [Lysobacter yananisis]
MNEPLRPGAPIVPSALALTPLLLFLALFFGAGLYFTAHGDAMGFYQLHAPVAILPALALAAFIAWRRGIKPLETLLEGMGDHNVVLMCLIFLLAGGFVEVSKAIGAVDAIVALGVGNVHPALLLPALFVVAGFISMSLGTSMGTIAAVAPIALGVSDASGLDRALVLGAVIGGATFGDNLSVISDTAIVASRTQGCTMREKFRENLKLALPAALGTLVLLGFLGETAPVQTPDPVSPWLILPYLIVLGLAIAGVDVIIVLSLGLVVAGLFGVFFAEDFGFAAYTTHIWDGFESMVEITLLSLLVGGLGALMKAAGGLAWLAQVIGKFARGHRSRRAGEVSIAALSATTDVFTANNTVAILISGGLARDVAQQHGVPPARAASVLDIFACVTQGILPYGAQILLAASLSKVSPLQLVGNVHYSWLLGAVTIVAMLWPSRKLKAEEAVAAG